MSRLARFLGKAVGSGSTAAVAAAAAAAQCARANGATPFAPLNAVTHCVWLGWVYGALAGGLVLAVLLRSAD